MSSVALAPLLGIDGPLPLAPKFNFFSVALDLDDPRVREQLGIAQGDRWQAGVNVVPRPTQTPLGWEPCSAGTMRTKENGEARDWFEFLPFVAYIPDFCSAMGIGDFERFKELVEDALFALESYAAELQFASGSPIGTNLSLNHSSVDDLGVGSAVGPIEGAALLENAIGETGRAGVLHVTPGIATSLAANDLVYQNGDVLRTIARDTAVIVGNGYIGTDPDTKASPSGDTEWAFATGPVFAGRGPVRESDGPISEWLDREVNDVTYRGERELLVGWDGALLAGVRIDRSATP